jgi:hypothetical protein
MRLAARMLCGWPFRRCRRTCAYTGWTISFAAAGSPLGPCPKWLTCCSCPPAGPAAAILAAAGYAAFGWRLLSAAPAGPPLAAPAAGDRAARQPDSGYPGHRQRCRPARRPDSPPGSGTHPRPLANSPADRAHHELRDNLRHRPRGHRPEQPHHPGRRCRRLPPAQHHQLEGALTLTAGSWPGVLAAAGEKWRRFRATEETPGVRFEPPLKTWEWLNTGNGSSDRFPLSASRPTHRLQERERGRARCGRPARAASLTDLVPRRRLRHNLAAAHLRVPPHLSPSPHRRSPPAQQQLAARPAHRQPRRRARRQRCLARPGTAPYPVVRGVRHTSRDAACRYHAGSGQDREPGTRPRRAQLHPRSSAARSPNKVAPVTPLGRVQPAGPRNRAHPACSQPSFPGSGADQLPDPRA